MTETYEFPKKLHSCDELIPYKHQLRDFKNALWLVWRHLGLPEPDRVQYDMADYLQHGPDRSCIQAFRGVGKSWITVTFSNWVHLLNPYLNNEIVSASKDLSDNFTKFALQLIEDDELALFTALLPRPEQRRSSVQFDVGPARSSKDPSVKSVGIFGQITGTRADLLIGDDIEVPKTSETPTQRAKLAERIKEFDAILKPGGKVVFLGTPQCDQSVYNLLAERGYSTTVWPARVPTADDMALRGPTLAGIVHRLSESLPEGSPMVPTRFSDEDLSRRELSYGRSGFRLQFMLDTAMSDDERYPLKIKDMVVMDLDHEMGPSKVMYGSGPDQHIKDLHVLARNGDAFYRPQWVSDNMTSYTGKMLYVDPSGHGKDELAWAVVFHLHGYQFVQKVAGVQGGYSDENLGKIAADGLHFKVNMIMVEDNFGDGMFGELLKPHLKRVGHPVALERHKVTRQKELRIISALEPALNQHRLIVNRAVIEEDYRTIQRYPSDIRQQYSLIYQMTRLTNEKGCLAHDDRLDALAGAVAYWTSQMAMDAEEADQAYRDELLDEEIRKWEEAAGLSPFRRYENARPVRPVGRGSYR